MKTWVLGIGSAALVAFGALLGALLRPTPAEGQSPGGIRGAGEAGVLDETLQWRGARGAERDLRIQRIVVKIPRAYGQLTNITGAEDQVLWFVDKDGNIRNVFLGSRLVRIQYEN